MKYKIGIVTSFFNPCKYKSLRNNVYSFVNGLGKLSERLTLVALEFDKEDTLKGLDYYFVEGSKPKNLLWQKECLLNIAIQNLPKEYNAVAWVDADILFDNQKWITDAEKALQTHQVVQLFNRCTYLKKDGSSDFTRDGIVARYNNGSAWGMAWAARREIVQDGLLDWAINGSGDAWMADAWFNKRTRHYGYSEGMIRSYIPWMRKQRSLVTQPVGYIHHTIRHLYHGTFKNRNYQYRNQLLVDHRFDPATDLIKENEIYAWRNPKSPLAAQLMKWFKDRKEDE